ncbi:MAG: VTT domain-containing protein [Bryobacteraceae bacterium]
MKGLLAHLALFFASLGGFGLLLLGILDSSFLFMPLGNDLLVVALTAQNHGRMPYYAFMATVGSVVGCFITDWVSRKGGEKGLEGRVKGSTLNFVKKKVEKKAGPALAIAALMPPPFPFTPFVIVLAALQYHRGKLLGIIAGSRAIRFAGEGFLAIYFGKHILAMAQKPIVQWTIIGLVIVSIAGSAYSIYTWVQRSRKRPESKKDAGSEKIPHASSA